VAFSELIVSDSSLIFISTFQLHQMVADIPINEAAGESWDLVVRFAIGYMYANNVITSA
jgi:hypothetical protein